MSSIQNTNPRIRPASPMIEDEPKSKRVKKEYQETVEQKNIEHVFQEIIAQPAPLEDAALTKFEADLIRAGNGEYLPAAKRLALFICKRIGKTSMYPSSSRGKRDTCYPHFDVYSGVFYKFFTD